MNTLKTLPAAAALMLAVSAAHAEDWYVSVAGRGCFPLNTMQIDGQTFNTPDALVNMMKTKGARLERQHLEFQFFTEADPPAMLFKGTLPIAPDGPTTSVVFGKQSAELCTEEVADLKKQHLIE